SAKGLHQAQHQLAQPARAHASRATGCGSARQAGRLTALANAPAGRLLSRPWCRSKAARRIWLLCCQPSAAPRHGDGNPPSPLPHGTVSPRPAVRLARLPSARTDEHYRMICAPRPTPTSPAPARAESATCLDRLRELGDLGFSGVERAGLLASRLPSPVGVF